MHWKLAVLQRVGCLKKWSLFNITVYKWLVFGGIKVSNRSRLSHSVARHLQMSILKVMVCFSFSFKQNFHLKKVFQKRLLLVLLGNFFRPNSTWAPGGLGVRGHSSEWAAVFQTHGVSGMNLSSGLELGLSASLFPLFSTRFPTSEHCALDNLSDIYTGYNVYDPSRGCSVYNLHNYTVTALGGEFRNLPTLSTLQT